ncbi:uncharacterized protein [Rutidosis leptorrhynchoides]|uniref:uncharacterized protein n=1 Tax=Rutidosis leptorrhynchoides TaxID=125765 RepID=UPI003A9972A0
MTELERQKWNVRPFISHKRTSLPKSTLQKLKEVLLEGNHPQLASLKEMSNVGGENVLKNTILKEHEIYKESPVIGLEGNTLTDDVDPTLSKKLEDTCGNVNIDLGEDDNDILPNVSISGPSRNGKNPIENGSQLETGTDSEKSYDEGTDIASKKEAFLSSQQTLSQDFMATIDCSEIYLCMKCNKDGQLLVCSSDTCPIRVHERCVGSAAKFDENGNYFCPFCAYSHAISKYLEVKKKASLARKNVQAFLSSGIKDKPEVYSEKEACLDNNELSPTRDVGPSPKKDKVSSNEDTMMRSKDHCVPAGSPH